MIPPDENSPDFLPGINPESLKKKRTNKLPEVIAKETGIYLKISKDELLKLPAKKRSRLEKAATVRLVVTSKETEESENVDVTLYHQDQKGNFFLPKGVQAKYLKIYPTLKIERGTDGETSPFLQDVEKYLPHKLDIHQEECLNEIKARRDGGLLNLPMGAGKAMLVCALVYGLPFLRPAAISGRGTKDVRNLVTWLKKIGAAHPEIQEPIYQSGAGKTLGKRAKKALNDGEGIFVCTHSGLQNLPENTALLVLDEAHECSTPLRIAKIFDRENIRRIYGLSATLQMRKDGGDNLLEAICGPVFLKKAHHEFEEIGRVAPTELHAYRFYGTGDYAHNPSNPTEEPPEGYSMHNTWIENHQGRHLFLADLLLNLPQDETKLLFTPHILHAIHIKTAFEKRAQEFGVKITPENEPILAYSENSKSRIPKKYRVPPREIRAYVRMLEKGLVHNVLSTDFLAVGFDTNQIDHIIDASGQGAFIKNIQRSGRGTRTRILPNGESKINRVHVVIDHTVTSLRITGERKMQHLRNYYGHGQFTTPSKRKGGYFLHRNTPWQSNHPTEASHLPPLPLLKEDPFARKAK